MMGSHGFSAIVSVVWTVILTSLAIAAVVVLCVLGGWKLAEIIWRKVSRRRLAFKSAYDGLAG